MPTNSDKTKPQPMLITGPNPLLLVAVEDVNGKTQTQISGSGELTVPKLGLIIADLVRHGAAALNVHEDEVWCWVDLERQHPTTELHEVKPQ